MTWVEDRYSQYVDFHGTRLDAFIGVASDIVLFRIAGQLKGKAWAMLKESWHLYRRGC